MTRDVDFSIVLRSAADQTDFDTLRAILTTAFGLDWRGMSGEPDGDEIADDCAELLWSAGFRIADPLTTARALADTAAIAAGSDATAGSNGADGRRLILRDHRRPDATTAPEQRKRRSASREGRRRTT